MSPESPENHPSEKPALRPRILLDARLTRRKTYHILYDPDAGEIYRSLTPSAAIHAAIARGYTEIVLDDMNPLGPLELVLIVKRKDPSNG